MITSYSQRDIILSSKEIIIIIMIIIIIIIKKTKTNKQPNKKQQQQISRFLVSLYIHKILYILYVKSFPFIVFLIFLQFPILLRLDRAVKAIASRNYLQIVKNVHIFETINLSIIDWLYASVHLPFLELANKQQRCREYHV